MSMFKSPISKNSRPDVCVMEIASKYEQEIPQSYTADMRKSHRTPTGTRLQEDSLFVCFVALRPKLTATGMVTAGRSVHLTTLFS